MISEMYLQIYIHSMFSQNSFKDLIGTCKKYIKKNIPWLCQGILQILLHIKNECWWIQCWIDCIWFFLFRIFRYSVDEPWSMELQLGMNSRMTTYYINGWVAHLYTHIHTFTPTHLNTYTHLHTYTLLDI